MNILLTKNSAFALVVVHAQSFVLQRLEDDPMPTLTPPNHRNDCGCRMCLSICPGYDNYQRILTKNRDNSDEHDLAIKKAYICHATDSTIRSESSSGGYVTALLTALLETKKISGVITLRPDATELFEYTGGLIKEVKQLKRAQGSVYHPVSTCEGLREVIGLEGQFAFVGKPCEVHAARLLISKKKGLQGKVPLLISVFCHHTPTRTSNRTMLRALKLSPDNMAVIKYRGRGWPGYFQVLGSNGECLFSSPYREIWDNYLSSGAPLPCQMCYDPYGQYADISVGDAWGFNDATGLGLSAVLLRTRNGEYYHNLIQNWIISHVRKRHTSKFFLANRHCKSKNLTRTY